MNPAIFINKPHPYALCVWKETSWGSKGVKRILNSLPATQDRAFYVDFPLPLPTPPEYSGSICCFQQVVILVTISHVAIFIYLMPHALFPLVLIMERMVILLYHLFPLMQVGQASLLSHKTLAAYLRLQNHLGWLGQSANNTENDFQLVTLTSAASNSTLPTSICLSNHFFHSRIPWQIFVCLFWQG